MSDYTKLSAPTTNTGNFVKTLVDPSTGDTGFAEGFNAHKTWIKKCLTFDQAMEAMQRSVEEREDIACQVKDVDAVVGDGGDFYITVDGRNLKPTQWAISQLTARTSEIPLSIISNILARPNFDWEDANICVNIVRNELRRCDKDKNLKIRTYTDGTLRAVLSDKYQAIDNRWYLETINKIIPDSLFSHWRSDDDTIYGNVLIPNSFIDYGEDDSDYGGMVSIGNCEIGNRKMSQIPSVFRSICMNGCIWDKVSGMDFSRKHIGKINFSDLSDKIRKNIEQQLPLVPDIVRQFLSTKGMEATGSMKKILAGVCNEFSMTKKQSQEVLSQYVAHEMADKNMFGVINSITRAGQKFDNVVWNKFDHIAGELANTTESKWKSSVDYYNSLPDKFVEEVFV